MDDNINQIRLKNYIDAEAKALVSQEYEENGKRNRRANLNDIGNGINKLQSAGGLITKGRAKRVVFRDY